MPRRHVSAQRLIACVPRRNRPPTRLRARNFAYIGTVQPDVGQTLGRAAQIQRLPTPSRALCLETHQTRPCPRNHRPGRVRTWSRLESGRTIAGRLTSPTCPPAPRAAVGIHSFATRQIGSARCCALQLPRYTASRSSWQLVCMCCRARMACASRLLCDNRSRRRQAPTLGVVAWVPCAAYIPPGMHHPGARSTHRPQAVVIPRLSLLGWPRMRGVASVCSQYARIPNHLRFA
jgi:hypothetical protein